MICDQGQSRGKTSGTEEHGVTETEKTRIAEQHIKRNRIKGKNSKVNKNIGKIEPNDLRAIKPARSAALPIKPI